MKNFRYPLEQLKKFRELELVSVADEMRLVVQQMYEIDTQFAQHQSSITNSHGALMNAEKTAGAIKPDLRKLTALYVHSVQLDQEALEKTRTELKTQQENLHVKLLEKKQSVKIMESHQERLVASFKLTTQKLEQNEDDELWLTRPRSKALGDIA